MGGPDELLFQDFQGGNPQAFDVLFERHHRKLLRYLIRRFRLSCEDAEEITQSTFSKVTTAAETFDPQKGRFATWLYSIAHNEALSLCRSRCRFVHLAELGPDGDSGSHREWLSPDPSEGIVNHVDLCRALTSLAKQSPKYRAAVRLVIEEELRLREAAEKMQAPVSTIHRTVENAVERLRSLLLGNVKRNPNRSTKEV